MCRICLEEGGRHFCACTGTCALVHAECLQKWVDISHRSTCEICLAKYTFPKHFECRCHLRFTDISLSKHRNVCALCCSFGFVLFMINFFFSTLVNTFLVNIVTSNIISILVVSFSVTHTQSLQFYIYLSVLTCMSNVLVLTHLEQRSDTIAYFIQCGFTASLICFWAVQIMWRDSWVISTINVT